MGEEDFFINNITKLLIDNVLTNDEKQFNLNILYAKDTSVNEIVYLCRKYPIMSNYQVILIKEAQALVKQLDRLSSYIKNPSKTTILILNFKHKSLDKRKSIYKLLQTNGLIFESKRLYDYQIQNWIHNKIKNSGYQIDNKCAALINEFIGNNLTQISNEIEKLIEIKKDDKKITLDDIQKYIGVSKEYNNFELRKAIAEKNKHRAIHIAQFFSKNSSLNPLVLTTSIIFDFFKKLLIYHSIKSKNEKVIATKLKINPYFLSEFSVASKNYSLRDTVKVISIIRDFDMYSKGLYIKKINPKLIEELVIRILAD